MRNNSSCLKTFGTSAFFHPQSACLTPTRRACPGDAIYRVRMTFEPGAPVMWQNVRPGHPSQKRGVARAGAEIARYHTVVLSPGNDIENLCGVLFGGSGSGIACESGGLRRASISYCCASESWPSSFCCGADCLGVQPGRCGTDPCLFRLQETRDAGEIWSGWR